MRICRLWMKMLAAAVHALPLAAQVVTPAPMLSSVEAPYPAIQSAITIGGARYTPGTVAYGPVGTPLVLSGKDFGGGGNVLFPVYNQSGAVAGKITSWSESIIFVTVPANAGTGGIYVVSDEGKRSNPLPFVVTKGSYLATCPAFPSQKQLVITTDSLPNAMLNGTYSAALNASGGTPPYNWSFTGPAWLTLNASSGALNGKANSGSAALNVNVTDSQGVVANAVLNLTVDSQPYTSGTVYSYCVPGPNNPSCTVPNPGFDEVGNVKQYSDSVMGQWSFGYDHLNRLTSAVPATGAYSGQNQQLCMNYDSFGNRTQSDFQTTACNPGSDPATATYNAANQVTWLQGTTSISPPDASGNMTNDGINYYAYDGEGRLCATETWPYSGGVVAYGYLYDAEGRRVAKGTVNSAPYGQAPSCDLTSNGFTLTESYVLGQGGERQTTFAWSLTGGKTLTSAWQSTNVYGEGKLLATYDAAPNPAYTPTNGLPAQIAALHFHLTDPLGTRRVQTDENGEAELDCQSLPFGDQLSCFPDPNAPNDNPSEDATGSLTSIHFTGKDRDAESGNDYFGARYYASSIGRFMSPDPSGLTYANINNPQSFNLYSYALNNPLSNVDPTGLYCFYGGAGDTVRNDSDASDYDFTSDGPGECGGSGGRWIDNPSTTVTASGGGSNGNTLSAFPTDVSQNYQFIPGKGCSAALRTAGANSSAINNYYNQYQTPINNAASASGIAPNYLAAIGVRESGLPANPDVVQPNGSGRGLFQIDLGAHPGVTTAQAFNPSYSANYAGVLLAINGAKLADQHPNLNDAQLTQATAASYNFGTGSIRGNPNTIDAGTTGGNYGSNVVAIAVDCF